MCYDNKTLKMMQQNKILAHEDNIINAILQNSEPFIYGDQIVISILAQENKSPIGIQLMNYLFDDMKQQNIRTMYISILHKPTLYTKSKQFCTKIGFKQVDEITNIDNTTWGIYKFSF